MRSLARIALLCTAGLCLSLAPLACGRADFKRSTTTSATSAAGARTDPSSATDATSEPVSRAQPAESARRDSDRCTQIVNTYNRTLRHSPAAAKSPIDLRRSSEADARRNRAALANAPNQIRPDLQTLVDAWRKVTDALDKVNYVASKLSLIDTAALDTPSVKAASARIFSFISQGCTNRH